ncbi:hypothetical protein Mame01_27130 [Microbispora amethystogenes]|nr:hypothetical protein Mame01_27130 [Microbispora amethystogenes]
MVFALVRTFEMTPPMLPVVSIRNVISGLGGIAGVDTVLAIVVDSPGLKFSVTSAGVTPGAADAVPAPATSIAPATTAHTAARTPRVILTVSFLLVRPYAATNSGSLAVQISVIAPPGTSPPHMSARADTNPH